MQILRKLAPLAVPPDYLPPWPSWESNIVLGGFLHLSQLKFEKISPKMLRMQILIKLSPLWPLFTCPPSPPGSQKFLGEVSGIYFSSSLRRYHRKYQECRF